MIYDGPVSTVGTKRKCPVCNSVLILQTKTIRIGVRRIRTKTRGTKKFPVYGPGKAAGFCFTLVCTNTACDYSEVVSDRV